MKKIKCLSCGQLYEEEPPFLTCPHCRKPLPDCPGGCRRWLSVRNTSDCHKRSKQYKDHVVKIF